MSSREPALPILTEACAETVRRRRQETRLDVTRVVAGQGWEPWRQLRSGSRGRLAVFPDLASAGS